MPSRKGHAWGWEYQTNAILRYPLGLVLMNRCMPPCMHRMTYWSLAWITFPRLWLPFPLLSSKNLKWRKIPDNIFDLGDWSRMSLVWWVGQCWIEWMFPMAFRSICQGWWDQGPSKKIGWVRSLVPRLQLLPPTTTTTTEDPSTTAIMMTTSTMEATTSSSTDHQNTKGSYKWGYCWQSWGL